jgi:hypothetical protein
MQKIKMFVFQVALYACLSMTANSASATLVSIDFSGPSVGDIVTNQFAGVDISLLGSPSIPGPRIYLLQDTGGNPVDVLGATGNAITPGDNVGGINPPFFDMQFSFPSPIDYFSIQVLDAEESVTATAYSGDNALQSVSPGRLLGYHAGSAFNGPVYVMELGSLGGSMLFDRVVVDLNEADGPELFDNLQFSVRSIPEPPSIALLVAGLTSLFSRRRLR